MALDARSKRGAERFDAETAVLLGAVRGFLGTGDGRCARLGEDVDWDLVVSAASRHGITPVVHRQLAPLTPRVPEEAVSELERASRRIARRNLLLLGETLSLVEALARRGVRAVPYKGPVLAASVYGDVALRQSNDIDLLVREADLEAASSLLAERGYARRPAEVRYEAVVGAHASSHHRTFVHGDTGVEVELHRRFNSPRWVPSLRTDAVFDSLVSADIDDRTVDVLDPETRIVVLCVHGSKHGWCRLEWLHDVAQLVRGRDVDWAAVLARAERWGVLRMVLLGVYLVEDLLWVALPPGPRSRVADDPAVPGLAAEMLEMALPEPVELAPIDNLKLQLRTADRRRDGLRSLLRVVFVPSMLEVETVRLPPALSPLYYGLRPLRLGYTYLQGDL